MRVHAVEERKVTWNHVIVVTKGLNVFVLLLFCLFVFCSGLYYLLTLLQEKSLYLLLNKNAAFDSGH